MSAKTFLEEYIGNEPAIRGIPNFEMNAPLVRPNPLGEIGIEIEVEGRRLPTQGFLADTKTPKSGTRWIVKPDGSLRNGGQEYVLETPCYREELEGVLNTLWTAFTVASTTFDITNRCSTHVHINQGGQKINQITSIIALWTTFEQLLINWCGEERKTNHFCLASKDCYNLIQAWNDSLKTGRFTFHDGFKYLGLNVRPLWTFGSLEFRTMRADERIAPIHNWILFVYSLCRYASERYENPQLLANDLSERGGRELFIDICRNGGVSDNFVDEVFSIEENREFEREVLNGFRLAQPLVMEHPWGEWLEIINKLYIPSPFSKKGKKIERLDDMELIERAFERARGEPRPFLRNEVAPAPVRNPQNRYDEYRIDPRRPVEFVDGTPAEVERHNQREGLVEIGVRATLPKIGARGVNLQNFYSYNTATGWWSGDSNVARIRNVGALPVVAREIGEEIEEPDVDDNF